MNTIVEHDVQVAMSDGVRLYADVYRPAAPGKYPTVVTRTPYLKETERFTARAHYFAEHGYVYVIQDVRGRGKSGGDFYPFFAEARDGYDTLGWASEQSWSNGLLGTIGASYSAWTQWLCASMRHPNLVTMVAEASPPDFFHCLPYQGGAFGLPLLSWLVQVDGHTDQDIGSIHWESVLKTRPLRDMDRACGRQLRAWQDWLQHDREDHYWSEIAFNRRMNQISLPVFHISGWYDDVLIGTLINYAGMCDANLSRRKKCFQKLLIGPWPHRINTTSRFGAIDFGDEGIINLFEVQRKWFDFWLKGSDDEIVMEPPVRFHVLGAREWHSDVRWPPSRVRMMNFYLHSRGSANTKDGNGRLDTSHPVSESADEYTYDPMSPVPFLSDPGWIQLGGPDNYSAVEDREDVLVYSTEPLEKDLRIAGPIVVNLFAVSSASDTDFTAKLLDVHPDGYAMRLNDGIVRARFRNSRSRPTPIVPGRIYEYRINCWATGCVFRRGHRIRVEISSSAFPKFDPNLNTGRPIATDQCPVVAWQRIYHDSENPSHVVLPVLVD
jgi:putative CocE/NonD family hydrolase